MIIEIVTAGLILMLVWWLFKSGLVWLLLGLLALMLLGIVAMNSQSIAFTPV